MHLTILGPVLQWFVKDWNYSINYLLQIGYAALDHSWVDLILPSLAPVFANGAKDSQRRALLLKTSMTDSKITFIQSTQSLVQLLAQQCTYKPEPAGPTQFKNCTSCCSWPLRWIYSVSHESCWGFCFRSKCWSSSKSLCYYRPKSKHWAIMNMGERTLDEISLRKGRRK